MSLQLKKKSRFTLTTSAVLIVGATFLLVKTFPHIKQSVSSLWSSNDSSAASDDDTLPIEVNPEDEEVDTENILADGSVVDVSEWSEANLKSFLLEKEVSPPPNATHDGLVTIVKSLQKVAQSPA